MPELPEAERMRRDLEAALKGKKITKVVAYEDPIVFTNCTHETFMQHVLNRKVTGSGRHGKHFWLVLDEKPCILLHAGMTGHVRVKGETPLSFMDFSVKDVWPPRFVKWIVTTEDGTEAAFSDARRLGRVRLVDDPKAEPPVSLLGFDPYLEMPPFDVFCEKARKRAVAIKALLLDQAFSAGVGNWIADEILFQARIHPEERVQALDDKDMREIYDKMESIIKTACDAGADSSLFPKEWLFHVKWSKGKKDARTLSGLPISFVTVGGRTSAFVPSLQKLKPKRPQKNGADGGKGDTVPRGKKGNVEVDDEVYGEGEEEEVADSASKKRRGKPAPKAAPKRKKTAEEEAEAEEPPVAAKPARGRRKDAEAAADVPPARPSRAAKAKAK
ncbi:Formamidopyrimidine-DNA glycosylase N-terminal domain-containing protein [Hyaloraphidium curvatum]|nr:Formamidopyrimidine-DNA glycosylase N-terminal domain-containing protein [Hyaloraphidium curvatum]